MIFGLKPAVDFAFKKIFGSPQNVAALIEGFPLEDGLIGREVFVSVPLSSIDESGQARVRRFAVDGHQIF